jgi:ubiquinone biosynthesis protein UbiJ
MNEWRAEPFWEWWSIQMAEIRVEQAEAEVKHTGWQLKKLENRLDKLSQQVQRRGRVAWPDLRRLKSLKPYR